MAHDEKRKEKQSFLKKFCAIGDKFPHPIVIFLWMIVIVLVLAHLMDGTEFQIPGQESVSTINTMFNRAGLTAILTKMFTNFSGMAIVPILIVMAAAVGIGEATGFWETLIIRCFRGIPDKLVIFLFLFICINGNLMSDASLIIFPALGALLFQSHNKNPLLGVTLAYCGYLAGLSANVLLASTDANCAAITESVLPTFELTKDLTVHVASNYYFMCISAFALAAVGTFVTVRFVEPALNREAGIDWKASFDMEALSISDYQRRGLRAAGVVCVVFIALVLALVLPENGLLRNDAGGILPKSPFMSSIVPLLSILFALLGIVYGIAAKTVSSSTQVISGASAGIRSVAAPLLTLFVAAQFNAYMTATNLAAYIAVSGANWLVSMNLTGIPLILAIMVFVMLLNFVAESVSTKWTMIAGIVIPMMAILGYHPAYAQTIYRVGDALTNSINPIMYYIPLILEVARKYKKDAGIGTIIAYQFPYFIAFTILWSLMLVVWFVFDLPLGPGAPVLIG